jgi:hypothetical protein
MGRHLGLGQISDPAVHPALEQVDLGQDHLVVEPLELGEQGVDEHESGLVLAGFQLPIESSGTHMHAEAVS